MKIALIHNLNRGKSERETEFDSVATIDFLKKIISKQHDCRTIEASQAIASWLKDLNNYNPDLIFNIAEGYVGPAREAFYPALFDQLKYKYCGPDPTNLLICLNKSLTKFLLKDLSINLPRSYVYNGEKIANDLEPPYIIKLNEEGSSIGMDKGSVVKDESILEDRLKKLYQHYQKNILVEEFIKGKDVSMAYIEGIGIVGPATVEYQRGEFYDYSLKSWDDKSVKISGKNGLSKKIIKQLLDFTTKAIARLDIKGYAKIDFRLSDDEQIYFLEINGQVSFHPDGEFAHCCLSSGFSLEHIVEHIINHRIDQRKSDSIGVNEYA